MKKLIRLELQKNNWKPYWITTSITTLVMLGFIYLIVLIPYLEPRDDDAVLFGTYNFVIGLSIDVMTGIFTIMSTTMLAKIIVEEQIVNLSKTYRKGKIKANDNITVTLMPNEVTALIGHNGAGKTTLLNQIVGNVKPDSGTITYNGISFIDNTKLARNYVSMMPQFHAPLVGVTLRQAIESVLRIRGASGKIIGSYTNQVIKDLDIGQWADQPGDKLSGGLQRLTSFAMSVVYPAQIILLDEPTNDIDPVRRKLVWQYMKKLAKEGHIILVVTHNLLEVEQYADRYILMDSGQIIREAPTSTFNNNFAASVLSVNFDNFNDWENIPDSMEHKFIKDEMKMIFTLSSEQILDAIQWVLDLMKEGKILNYKLTSAILDVSYGGLVNEK